MIERFMEKVAKEKYYDHEIYGPKSTDSAVTKRVKDDFLNMTDKEFSGKYKASKRTYARRVKKYGDPYKNSPLPAFGKKMSARQKEGKFPFNLPTYKHSLRVRDKVHPNGSWDNYQEPWQDLMD